MELQQNADFPEKGEGFQSDEKLTQKRQFENVEIVAIIVKKDD